MQIGRVADEVLALDWKSRDVGSSPTFTTTDQVANVGAGTRLQNVKHEFDSHPGLKKVWEIFGGTKIVTTFVS